MTENKSLADLKREFNESIFFSTEVSSQSQFNKESERYSKNVLQISQAFKLQPYMRLKRIKQEKRQVYELTSQALKDNIRARSSHDKTIKEAALYRHQFAKIYRIRAFKTKHEDLINENKKKIENIFRNTTEKISRFRMIDQYMTSMRKDQESEIKQYKQRMAFESKRQIRQKLRKVNELFRRKISENGQKVRKQKQKSMERKNNLSEMASTRSKFNYMIKVNKEIQAIRDYQQILQEIKNQSKSGENGIFSLTYTSRS